MNQSKRFNYQNGKKKYYSNLKNLLTRMDRDVATKDKDTILEEGNMNTQFNMNMNNQSEEKEKLKIDKVLCSQCNKNEYKYICPKCKIKYCSVDCYKAHSTECTEDFYKRSVEEELKSLKIEEDDSKKFRRTLKDYYEKMNKDNNDIGEILTKDRRIHYEKLLEKIESNTIDYVMDLTPDDWKDFNRYINGYMENKNSMEIWNPFWNSLVDGVFTPSLDVYESNLFDNYDEKSIKNLKELEINGYIEYINTEDKTEEEYLEDYVFDETRECIELNNQSIPINRDIVYKSILLKNKDIPSIDKLSKIKPSLLNKNSLVFILCNVIHIFKLYNGEIFENIADIVDILFENCKILYEKDIIYNSVEEALNEFFIIIARQEKKYFSDIRNMVLNDMLKIVMNKFYIFESLIRLYETVHKYINEEMNKNTQRKLTLVKNKIIYFLSYTKCIDSEVLLTVVEDMNEYMKSVNSLKK